jgi:hypothetical protein
MACDHRGHFISHPPVPIQVGGGGALLITAVICKECGDVEYRSPPLNTQDETDLQDRVDAINRKNELIRPLRKGDVQ